MRRRLPIVLAVCLSLLGLQLGGLHIHADGNGLNPALRGMHVHGAQDAGHAGATPAGHGASDTGGRGEDPRDDPNGGHDHTGDRDVSVVKLSAAASKLLVFLVGLGLGLPFFARPAQPIRPSRPLPPPRDVRDRWRPPLRAPPRFSP